jgi:hypothetical protein
MGILEKNREKAKKQEPKSDKKSILRTSSKKLEIGCT